MAPGKPTKFTSRCWPVAVTIPASHKVHHYTTEAPEVVARTCYSPRVQLPFRYWYQRNSPYHIAYPSEEMVLVLPSLVPSVHLISTKRARKEQSQPFLLPIPMPGLPFFADQMEEQTTQISSEELPLEELKKSCCHIAASGATARLPR